MTVGGCSLFADLGGLSSDERVVFVPIMDGGAAEAGTRAGPEDSSTRDDAATDASNGSSFCVGRTSALCADFDDIQNLDSWGQSLDPDAGTIGLDTSHARSGPRALRATMPRREDLNQSKLALAYWVASRPWARVVVELDVFVEPLAWVPGDINAGILIIELNSSVSSEHVFLTLGEAYSQVGSSNFVSSTGPAMPQDNWVHVRIDFDPKGTLNAKLGVNVLPTANFPALTQGNNPNIRLGLGISSFNDPVPEFTVYYDNVTLDLIE